METSQHLFKELEEAEKLFSDGAIKNAQKKEKMSGKMLFVKPLNKMVSNGTCIGWLLINRRARREHSLSFDIYNVFD